MSNNKKIPIETLTETLDANIVKLRDRLRKEAQGILPEIPPMGEVVTGKIFVESVGSIVDFDQYGNFEFLYTPDTLPLRNPGLSESEKSREKIFNDIAQQLPDNSRILNIGTGGDATIPICMENSGHEIISTDLSQSTINKLSKNINSPTFACDLYYLDEVLPGNSVDFILGNSTLGYVDPKKLHKVIQNLSRVMKNGGIFTFDLTPHPIYFQAIDLKSVQTVVNESDVDPTKMIDFVEKYGVQNGINAMAYYQYYRAHYTNIAVLFLIKELFEKEGLSCIAGSQQLSLGDGGSKIQLSLRVSKGYQDVLNFIAGENELNNETAYDGINDEKIWYRLALIDRKNGEILARKFGINTSKKSNPWNVAQFINENLSPKDLPSEIKNEVLQDIDPWKLIEIIRPFLHDKVIPTPKPLPLEIIADQTMHKMVIDGTTPLSPEEADARIDGVYRRSAEKKNLKEQRRQEKIKQQNLKRKRKQARKNKKKNRK